jgi:adenine phosphoribosyltransferase
MDLKQSIRSIPDWPIKGVIFRDITSLLEDPAAFRAACDLLHNRYKDQQIDKIVAIDARGFFFGAVLAYHMNIGIVPVRKAGKLPPETVSEAYTLEYGSNVVEMRENAVSKGDRVLIIDDLIATGGTVLAAAKLVEKLGGEVVEMAFVIELPDLGGREKVKSYKIFPLMEFEGE